MVVPSWFCKVYRCVMPTAHHSIITTFGGKTILAFRRIVHYICNRKDRANAIAQGDTARRCFVLPYSGLYCLWSSRSRKGHPIILRGITRSPLNLRGLSRLLRINKNPSRDFFTMGQKCADVWHAICFLE